MIHSVCTELDLPVNTGRISTGHRFASDNEVTVQFIFDCASPRTSCHDENTVERTDVVIRKRYRKDRPKQVAWDPIIAMGYHLRRGIGSQAYARRDRGERSLNR